MKNAMDRIGTLRSFLGYGPGHELAVDSLLIHARGELQWGDLVCYARSIDAGAMSPKRLARHADWIMVFPASKGTNPLRFNPRSDWRLQIHTLEVADRDTFDLGRAQVAWATTPARELLEWWEAWAREPGSVALANVGTPRAALDAKDAWSRDPTPQAAGEVRRREGVIRILCRDAERGGVDDWHDASRQSDHMFMRCVLAALRMKPAPYMSNSSEFAASVVRFRDFGGEYCEGSRADERQRLRAFDEYVIGELGLTDGIEGLNTATP